MKRLQYFLPVLMLLMIPCGCKKDKGEAPILPPYESMVIDFSNFSLDKRSGSLPVDFKGTESSTWEFAAGIAGIWNSLLSSNLEIPLAAYEAAAGNSAAWVSENLWQWSYTFTAGSDTYKVKLQGKTSTGSTTWKMYITLEGTGGYTDYLWADGTSKTDGTGGQWKFRQGPSSDVLMFQDDWTKDGDEITTVVYTYLKNDTNKDSYINYHNPGTDGFDSGYTIHFASGVYSDSVIEWNISTRDGRLKCADYLQDDNWYCWDTNKINKLCE